MATQLNNNGHKGIDALLEGEENITAGANAALDPTYKILNIGKGKVVAPLAISSSHSPEMILSRGRLGLYTADQIDEMKAGGVQVDEVNLNNLLKNLKELETQLKGQFVGMDEIAHLLMIGLFTGESVFMYSLPGAAKSSIAKKLAEGIAGSFFKSNLTPDMSKEDLFGPISVEGIKQGKWTREWSGLATSEVALLDEFFKGSPTVRNNVLSIAEEHTVSDSEGEHAVPLIALIAASNELIDPSARHAMWDRFLIRVELGYPDEPDQMTELFSSISGRRPITVRIDPAEIILLQGIVEYMAMNLPGAIVQVLVKALKTLQGKNINPSPRRRLGWARCVVAERLLDIGKGAVTPDHIVIGAHILWIDPKDKGEVEKVLFGLSSPERGMMIRSKADVEAFRQSFAKLSADADDPNSKTPKDALTGEMGQMAQKLRTIMDGLKSGITSPDYMDECGKLIDSIKNLRSDITEKCATLMASK